MTSLLHSVPLHLFPSSIFFSTWISFSLTKLSPSSRSSSSLKLTIWRCTSLLLLNSLLHLCRHTRLVLLDQLGHLFLVLPELGGQAPLISPQLDAALLQAGLGAADILKL